MRKGTFILALTLVVLFTFTACGSSSEVEVQTCEETQSEQGEFITVRFYYHSMELDPNVYSLPESFLYKSVDIPAANFEEIFIREFWERTGIPIMGIWFRDCEFYTNRLVVNLGEGADSFFDTQGSAGSRIYLTILDKTLTNLVQDGAYEILVNWQRGIMGSHFSFNNIAIVENVEIVDMIWYNLHQPDDIATLPNSSDGTIFVNGVALPARLFTAYSQVYPTHIPFLREIVDIFGWETINTGSQSAILRDGKSLGEITYVNYEYFMFNNLHRFDVNSLGINDAFISLNNNSYLPISLFKYMGYEVYTANRNVYISCAETSPPYMATQESAGVAEPSHTSNPFAVALLEYNAGGVDATEYNDIWGRDWLGSSTKAITVNIDDMGTQGVLAWRIIAPDGSPVPVLRLFGLHDGVLSYLDVGGEYAIEMRITEEGRVVEAMNHWGSRAYTLFGIEGGRLVRRFTAHVLLNYDMDGTPNEYSLLSGQPHLWENSQSITQSEFEDILLRYNLNDTAFWTDFADETEAILAKIFE
ncbi:MAG: hypothetical protein FWE05_11825 [Defluviitaleaceae bacterium]|nr:hypothetical protein [Defluviitaleaceae bacterium]